MGGLNPDARAALERIVAAVSLPVRNRARIGETEIEVGGPGGPTAGLGAALYAHFYIVPSPAPPPGPGGGGAFLETLRAANPVPQRFEDGWTVLQADAAGILLANPQGGQRRAALAEIVPFAGGIGPGQPVRLAVPRELVTAPGGHYVVLGRPIRDARAGTQTRFYWNVSPAGAAALLGAVGTGLERRRIPFQAMAPVAPEHYGRADGAVLYLNIEDLEAALDIVHAATQSVAPSLRAETPLFARRLGPGLAFAESPPTGDSFGMHRCRLVAEGLVAGFDRGLVEPEARLGAIVERFASYGLDLAALERNPATCYPYRLERLAA